MKFFLKFVFWCFAVVPNPTTHRRKEEDLVQLTYARKRGKRSNSGNQWRPSLCAISEDNLVTSSNSAAAAASPPRMVQPGNKFTGDSRSKPKFQSYDPRIRTDKDFRREPLQAFIPAFSPTAILF